MRGRLGEGVVLPPAPPAAAAAPPPRPPLHARTAASLPTLQRPLQPTMQPAAGSLIFLAPVFWPQLTFPLLYA